MNLRLIKTKENFENFVAAIFYFDLLLNGAYLEEIKVKKNYAFILSNLLQNNLDLPPFILNCFESFKHTKKRITFHVHQLEDEVDETISSLLFHSLDRRNTFWGA